MCYFLSSLRHPIIRPIFISIIRHSIIHASSQYGLQGIILLVNFPNFVMLGTTLKGHQVGIPFAIFQFASITISSSSGGIISIEL